MRTIAEIAADEKSIILDEQGMMPTDRNAAFVAKATARANLDQCARLDQLSMKLGLLIVELRMLRSGVPVVGGEGGDDNG